MRDVSVKSYIRKGKRVSAYTRKGRPKGKKRIIAKAKYQRVFDEYGRSLGFKRVK